MVKFYPNPASTLRSFAFRARSEKREDFLDSSNSNTRLARAVWVSIDRKHSIRLDRLIFDYSVEVDKRILNVDKV